MPDYQKGKIYKIYSLSNPLLLYVGSTTQPLCERLAGHKTNYKQYLQKKRNYTTSYKIFEECDDYRIELIENYPCDTCEQLNAREGFWIKELDCLNKVIVGRTPMEYYEDNKEKIKEYKKAYDKINYEKNKEKIKEKVKNYKENNIEKIKDICKKRYENNKEKIKERVKEWGSQEWICEKCNLTIKLKSKSSHLRSKNHLEKDL
jgi:hypothetical protein